MQNLQETPLIYTSKGNLPVSSLVRSDGWEFNPDGITYWEQYVLNSEIVKRNVARYQLPTGTELQLKQGLIG
jgi:hypothetical protein